MYKGIEFVDQDIARQHRVDVLDPVGRAGYTAMAFLEIKGNQPAENCIIIGIGSQAGKDRTGLFKVKIGLRQYGILDYIMVARATVGVNEQAGIIHGANGGIGISLPPVAPGPDRIGLGGRVTGEFDAVYQAQDGIAGVVERIHIEPLVVIDIVPCPGISAGIIGP